MKYYDGRSKYIDTPLPLDLEGSEGVTRRSITARRRRLLDAEWIEDASEMQLRMFGGLRTKLQGRPSTASNLFDSVVKQLSRLYARHPGVLGETEAATEGMRDVLHTSGLWSLSPRLQQYTEGLRECFLRPYLGRRSGTMAYRIVTPDHVTAVGWPEEPSVLAALVEARVDSYKGQDVVVWDYYDLRGESPKFSVLLPHQGRDLDTENAEDITGYYHPEYKGEWPWMRNGEPGIPYPLYHAAKPTELFAPRVGEELVEGALTCSVLWTYWLTVIRQAAYAQRWVVGGRVSGSETSPHVDDSGVYRGVVTDPTTLLAIDPTGTDPVQVGQWEPPVDPQTLGIAIADYEARRAVDYGVSPSDAQRSQSARSGYAISLSKESTREYTKQQEGIYRASDLETLAWVSLLSQRGLPEDGWRVIYQGPEPSVEETNATIAKWRANAELGVASVVDLYMSMNPGVSRDQAQVAVARVADENRIYGMKG